MFFEKKRVPTRTRGEKCPLVSANFWRAKSRTGIGTFFRTRPAFSHGNSANSGAKQAPSRGIIPYLNVRSKTSRVLRNFARFERDAGTKIGPTFHARIPRITVVRLRKLPQITISITLLGWRAEVWEGSKRAKGGASLSILQLLLPPLVLLLI